LDLISHEFGHSFINVSNENQSPFEELIKKSGYLQEDITNDMSKQGYGEWATTLEETILRACVIRQLEHFGVGASADLLQAERENGFLYIDTVYESLNTYLYKRDIYPEINMYIPEIISGLMESYPVHSNTQY
jgi:hypothetical protein